MGVGFSFSQGLRDIREVRNAAVGHPTDHRGSFHHVISRATLSHRGFTLWTTEANGETTHQDIALVELIAVQCTEVSQALEDVIDTLRAEENAHRARFRDQPLSDSFRPTAGYALEKLSDELREGRGLGEWGRTVIQEDLERFSASLTQRGLDVDAMPVLHADVSEVRGTLKVLGDALESGERLDAARLVPLLYHLRGRLREFKSVAQEIDAEYKLDA